MQFSQPKFCDIARWLIFLFLIMLNLQSMLQKRFLIFPHGFNLKPTIVSGLLLVTCESLQPATWSGSWHLS